MAKQQPQSPDNESFKDQRDLLKEINKEIGKQNEAIQEATKSYSVLQNVAFKLQNSEEEISTLNEKQLKSLQERSQIALRELKSSASQLKNKTNLSSKEKALLKAAKDKFAIEEEFVQKVEKELDSYININKQLGVIGGVLKGISKIPILGDVFDANQSLDAARKKVKETKSGVKGLGAAFGDMGSQILSSLTDSLALVGFLVKGFQMFLDIGFAADKQITDLSKSMAVSKEEATATRDRFIEIQNSGESIFNTTKNLVAAQMELADALGATRGFTEQQVKDQVMLTKEMQFSVEEAESIQKLAMANGMTAEGVTNSVIKQTSALAKQTGIQLDNKKVVQDVAKVSGQLRLQYANNPKLIAKAVVETKKLGINMEIAANAAKGLLDFESSIENELSAELLTGKALNLERARGLALNGDSVGAAKEMLAQVGSAAEFANMNVIQQEAIAKAVGMSTDDLANSLVTQENLKKLGDETRSQVEAEIKAAKKLGDMDKVRMLEASIGNEKEAQAALKDIDAQATFNQSIETLKSMLSSIVEGPAADFANWIGDSEKGADRLKGLFENIKTTITIVAGIIAGRMVFGLATSVASMIAQVALSRKLKAAAQEQAVAEGVVTALKVTGAEASTLGTATPLILGGLAAVMAGAAAYSMMNDGVISPTGGMVVSGPEGSIQLNKKDSIIAGTNLGGGGNNNQDSSALISAINGLRSDIKALASRPINTSVQIDGKELATMQGKYPNEAGDANGKVAYQMS
jgi:hypothetical protein